MAKKTKQSSTIVESLITKTWAGVNKYDRGKITKAVRGSYGIVQYRVEFSRGRTLLMKPEEFEVVPQN